MNKNEYKTLIANVYFSKFFSLTSSWSANLFLKTITNPRDNYTRLFKHFYDIYSLISDRFVDLSNVILKEVSLHFSFEEENLLLV